ncbi:MFS transporter, partial [Escherichia coli]|uniref:MFS transporter n=1 Tax=Escherichia coli TaxID=562 RepID=UPI00335BD477
SIICSPMTSLKTSIKTITYLSDIGCLEIQGASLIGKRLLMLIAIVSGMCFYASVLMATTPAVELELQILNAIFLGILCGIGMLYFQDLMPEKIGSATTLYANTSRVGWIIAGSVDGIMVEIWSYHALFWLAIGMLGIAMICLLFIKDI